MKVEHIFAPADARLLQHLLLYPIFLLCMWRSLRTGWQPLWRTLPLQIALALLFVIPASPLLMAGEYLTSKWYGIPEHAMNAMGGKSEGWPSWDEFVNGGELRTWIASATNFLVTYCFGVALMTGFAFYQRLRDAQLRSAALERALTSAHLQALRMQLSPHTLFNLLHTIRGQIIWDPPAAQTMVVQLGDLLRRLLTAGEREFSRLASQLQFVTLYLELQQKRFADRLSVVVPPRSGLPHAWVPSLILQPLVEYAVVHGLAGHEGAVRIEVEVAAAAETLTLRVVNTIAAARPAGAAGIRLANVRERLEVQFGERASFSAGPEGADLGSADPHAAAARWARGQSQPFGGAVMEVVIVDDEPAARRAVRECCEREADLKVIGEYGDARAALEAIRLQPPQVLFLDIQMDSMTGMELARQVDPLTLPLIVFVTAYDHYALEAFEVSAVDYLLKPFDDARFQATVARVRRRQQAANGFDRHGALATLLEQLENRARARADGQPRVLAEAGSRMHMLDVSQVEVIEADRNYVRLIIGRESFHARSTLQQAEKSFQQQPMLRISRSCLINMRHVKEISRTPRGDFILVMAGGTTVTSSEGYREPVRQYFERLKLAPA